MAEMKKRSLPRQNRVEIAREGLPNLLIAIRGEPLKETVALKLQPSLAKYLNQQGGAPLIRQLITVGLRRALDKPNPATCNKCINLDTDKEPPFCLVLCAYLDRKLLGQQFTCDYFQPKKEAVK